MEKIRECVSMSEYWMPPYLQPQKAEKADFLMRGERQQTDRLVPRLLPLPEEKLLFSCVTWFHYKDEAF
jgi:hypothetical protein